jgi:alkanesulfonate monooxygenase SsuD/methylene tetrahydromethanopterin reductase-like flavin-dependent oxidoreductase (luciferase family)
VSGLRKAVSLQMAGTGSLASAASVLEKAGLDGAWTTELPARDAILRALYVSAHTTRLTVGTGVSYCFTRHPVAMAAAAVEMQALTQDRFRLGLGTGHRAHWDWYGVDMTGPASRLQEYVSLMRAAFAADGRLEFSGRYYEVKIPGFRFPDESRTQFGHPPLIFGSGLSPAMLRAVGRSCDGILLHPLALLDPFLDQVALPQLEVGIRQGNRSFSLIASCITVIDDDRERARSRARKQLAFYLSQPGFAVAVAGSKWEGEVAQLRAMVSDNGLRGLDAGAAQISDSLLDACAVAGSPSDAVRGVEALEARLAQRGFQEIVFAPVYDGLAPDEATAMLADLGELAGSARPAQDGGVPK